MKKDKEWLKEEVKKLKTIHGDGYDEYTINGSKYDHAFRMVLELIEELDKPEQEKVVVPQFVAEYIEERKGMSEHWFEALDSLAADFHNNDTNKTGDRIFNWIMANPDLYVEGYRNGYTVEKEKLYRVKVDQGPNYLYVESLHLYSDVIKPLDFNYKFSAKEHALKFASRNQAKGVAELVDGEVEEVTD